MPFLSDYDGDWRRLVRDGIRSYMDVMAGLREAREYHYGRYPRSEDERDGGRRGFCIEVPLLWGTF